MPKFSEKTKLLAGTQIFAPLDSSVLKVISAFASYSRCKKGGLVFAQDSAGEALYIVRTGEISITRKIPNEADQEIARFVAGDSFGEMDLMTRSPRNAEARAAADSVLLRFPGRGKRFEDLLTQHPVAGARVLHSFLSVTAGRIRKANNILKENSPWIQELRKQVYGDKLTGLYNKTFLEERLPDYLKDTSRPTALLMVKPDNFKLINDTYGHEAGDQALILMAGLLRRILPEKSLAIRFMGNELSCVLPDTGKNRAAETAAEVREKMNALDLRMVTGGTPFGLTVSIGLAIFPLHTEKADELIAYAHELPLMGRARGGNLILFPEDKQHVEEIGKLLGTIEIFSDLQEEEIRDLVLRMKKDRRSEGELIFQEGDEGKELYIVLSGLVGITVKLPDGNDLEIAEILEGNFFGEMSIIEQAPRSATCKAKKESSFLTLHADDFYTLLGHRPETAMKIMYRMLSIVSRRLMNTGSLLSEMVRWGDDARKRAITDDFTGLFNRRFLDEAIVTQVSRAKAESSPLALIMVDLDHFGSLNKKCGEAFGDSVILAASDVFKKVFRESDILARYGGDEFTFLLPGTDSQTAKKLCDEVCVELRKLKYPEFPDIRISSSIGIATIPEDADALSDLKEQADKALYQAKEDGRDRSVTAGAIRQTTGKKDGI